MPNDKRVAIARHKRTGRKVPIRAGAARHLSNAWELVPSSPAKAKPEAEASPTSGASRRKEN